MRLSNRISVRPKDDDQKLEEAKEDPNDLLDNNLELDDEDMEDIFNQLEEDQLLQLVQDYEEWEKLKQAEPLPPKLKVEEEQKVE